MQNSFSYFSIFFHSTLQVFGASHLRQGLVLVLQRSWRAWGFHVLSVGTAPCGGWRRDVEGWMETHQARPVHEVIDESKRCLRWLDCQLVLSRCGERKHTGYLRQHLHCFFRARCQWQTMHFEPASSSTRLNPLHNTVDPGIFPDFVLNIVLSVFFI